MRDVRSGGEKPNVRRKYLSPDEARRVIEASGRVGRQGERDKLLLTMIYRHGLRVSEAVDLRWTDFDLDAPKTRPFHVRRLKGSKDSVHTLEPATTARLLKRLQSDADGPYVFRSERGGPMSADAVQMRPAQCAACFCTTKSCLGAGKSERAAGSGVTAKSRLDRYASMPTVRVFAIFGH